MNVRFVWDEAKRRTNLRKRGIDFADCEAMFRGYTVTAEDTRFDYGERRFISLGLIEDRVISVVHTEENGTIRFISARKATRYEQTIYFKAIAN